MFPAPRTPFGLGGAPPASVLTAPSDERVALRAFLERLLSTPASAKSTTSVPSVPADVQRSSSYSYKLINTGGESDVQRPPTEVGHNNADFAVPVATSSRTFVLHFESNQIELKHLLLLRVGVFLNDPETQLPGARAPQIHNA